MRAITLAPPQVLLTESLKLTVTCPQPSWAVATPVVFVLVSAGQSKTRSAGQIRLGLVLSTTVIVWTQLELFPQPSVAVQVRAITFVPAQLFVTESL